MHRHETLPGFAAAPDAGCYSGAITGGLRSGTLRETSDLASDEKEWVRENPPAACYADRQLPGIHEHHDADALSRERRELRQKSSRMRIRGRPALRASVSTTRRKPADSNIRTNPT